MSEIKIYSVFGSQTAKPFVINKASAEAVAEEKKSIPTPELNESEALRESDVTSPEAKN